MSQDTGENAKQYPSKKNPQKKIWYNNRSNNKCRGHYVGNVCKCDQTGQQYNQNNQGYRNRY